MTDLTATIGRLPLIERLRDASAANEMSGQEVDALEALMEEAADSLAAKDARITELTAAIDEHMRGEWAPISGDGTNKPEAARCWLARQLMDSKHTDEEAFGIVAYHPNITSTYKAASLIAEETKP